MAMRRAFSGLLVASVLMGSMGCAEIKKWLEEGDRREETSPQARTLEATLSRHEAAMDRVFEERSLKTLALDHLNHSAERRQTMTAQERVERLEAFIDGLIENLRKIEASSNRPKTLEERADLVEGMFPEISKRDSQLPLEDRFDLLERYSGIQRGFGSAVPPLDQRISSIENAGFALLQQRLKARRSSASLIERAEMAVIPTRQANGSYFKYAYLDGNGGIIQDFYAATGELLKGRSNTWGPLDAAEEDSLPVSLDEDYLQTNLERQGVSSDLLASVEDRGTIDPNDETKVLEGIDLSRIRIYFFPKDYNGKYTEELTASVSEVADLARKTSDWESEMAQRRSRGEPTSVLEIEVPLRRASPPTTVIGFAKINVTKMGRKFSVKSIHISTIVD
jgi:hypothetical protein